MHIFALFIFNKKITKTSLVSFSQAPMTSYKNPLASLTFFHLNIHPQKQTVMSYFGWHFWLVGAFRRSPSQKKRFEKANKQGWNFFYFPEIAGKWLPKKSKIAFFSVFSNAKVPFLKLIGSIAVFRIRRISSLSNAAVLNRWSMPPHRGRQQISRGAWALTGSTIRKKLKLIFESFRNLYNLF